MEGKMPNAGNKLVIEMAPWTNGDAIRSMTDEELAKFMALNTDCYYCKANDLDRCASLATAPCDDIWLDWLRQEALP